MGQFSLRKVFSEHSDFLALHTEVNLSTQEVPGGGSNERIMSFNNSLVMQATQH